jgi:hypothetical protein
VLIRDISFRDGIARRSFVPDIIVQLHPARHLVGGIGASR